MKVLIIGAGEVGYHLALRLSREQHQVVVVDRQAARLKTVSEQMDVRTLQGEGCSPTVLREAEVHTTDILIAVTDSDEVNMVACLVAKQLSPASTRVARIRSQDYLNLPAIFDKSHLDVHTVINPEREVAARIGQFLKVPAATSVTDFVEGRVKLVSIRIQPTCRFVGRQMAEIRTEGGPSFLVAAIEREGEVIIPRGDAVLLAEDRAYLITRDLDMDQVLGHFGLKNDPVRSMVIIGGGSIGRQVAQTAVAMGIKTRIIEKSSATCEDLVEDLDQVLVLNGDGTDLSLLKEENVGAVDVFAALTSDEENNVLIALLGRKLGAGRTIARVSHSGYVPLVSSLGLDLVVSPRFTAMGAILRLLRRGKVLAVSALKDEGPEVIEVEALATSGLVGKPLAEVKVPRGALVAALTRDGQVEIPTGATVVRPGDRLVIFVLPEAIGKLEKLLTVRLEYF